MSTVTIRVSEETRERLKGMKLPGMSYDEVLDWILSEVPWDDEVDEAAENEAERRMARPGATASTDEVRSWLEDRGDGPVDA